MRRLISHVHANFRFDCRIKCIYTAASFRLPLVGFEAVELTGSTEDKQVADGYHNDGAKDEQQSWRKTLAVYVRHVQELDEIRAAEDDQNAAVQISQQCPIHASLYGAGIVRQI